MSTAAERPSYGFARRLGATVSEWHDGRARVVHRPGVTVTALAELERFLDAPMDIHAVEAAEYDRLLQQLYQHGADDAHRLAADFEDDSDLKSLAEALPETEDLLEAEDDAPIIRLINALLTEAVNESASDIHIEPFENRLTVRMRVDGVLREVLTPERHLAPLLVSRIKVMAKLDIAEKRLPQDGRISLKVAGRPVDVRVSTVPAGHGERVVLRLLDKQAGRLDLGQLGMDPEALERTDSLIHKPHGIVLVTGPTGSGKTTTLYAALARLNNQTRNIMTVEDPIEYYLDGVGQMQVQTKVDMTFARGLRAILRQDPDVVMVGEMRDLETARTGVQASLTGHLVLSTLHTNSAIGAITRLRDMGVEPFLLASSLLGVLAQRLVRVLCPDCREPDTATAADCEAFGHAPDEAPRLYRPAGCEACRYTGYRGRTGIYELIPTDESLREGIHGEIGEAELLRIARRRSHSLREDGWRKVCEGTTSIEEVVRVTRED